MTTLAQQLDADGLARAIRQGPVPAHVAAAAAAAVDNAVQLYRAPGLEARRVAEEAAAAVKEALGVLLACVPPPPPPPPSPPPLPAPPLAPPPVAVAPRGVTVATHAAHPPRVSPFTLVPLGLALAALPLQGGTVGSLLVLGAAAASGVLVWRCSTSRRPVAPLPRLAPPPPPPPPSLPPLPPPAEPPPPVPAQVETETVEPETVVAETVVAAVRRALARIDDMVAHAERRRAARAEPTPLNDTLLEFLQDLAEAALRNRAEFALAKIEFRLPTVLEASDLLAVEYSPETAGYFDVDGDPAQAATRRPALLAGDRCLKRGLAASRPGRAA